MHKTVNLLFGATADYLPYAVVTAVSVKCNLNPDYKLKLYFLYAAIVKEISKNERNNIFEYAIYTLNEHKIEYEFINVTDKMYFLEGQNTGMWGKVVSYTHYLYLLAPKCISGIDKVIYLDTDMIVNCDLSEVYNIDLGNNLLAMAAPRGFEEMGEGVCNSGFVLLNLNLWKKEATLDSLLKFGLTIPECRFCDQNLLHQYFTVSHRDRIMHIDKAYNIFPQLFLQMPINEIKIMHFTGYEHVKPWFDLRSCQRAGFLWWKYARMTAFYELFIFKNIIRNTCKHKYGFLERLFSIKKSGSEKILTILGIQFCLKSKSKQRFQQYNDVLRTGDKQ